MTASLRIERIGVLLRKYFKSVIRGLGIIVKPTTANQWEGAHFKALQ
jgi:hypothetical protein